MPLKGPRGGFVRGWLPVLAYVVVIFVVSSQPRLAPPFRFSNSDKLYHSLEYGGLGFLLVRALRPRGGRLGPVAGGLAAFAIGAALGAADELYQRTVPGRESSLLDWMADLGGLVLSQLAYLAIRQE